MGGYGGDAAGSLGSPQHTAMPRTNPFSPSHHPAHPCAYLPGESAARTVRAALNQFEARCRTQAPAQIMIFRFVEQTDRVSSWGREGREGGEGRKWRGRGRGRGVRVGSWLPQCLLRRPRSC